MTVSAAESAERIATARDFKLVLPAGSYKDTAPLVVVLGWYGCKDRWLSKYGAELVEMGYPALQTICPDRIMQAISKGPMREYAIDMLTYLSTAEIAQNRKIVFYMFSNGGAFVWESMSLLLKEDRFSGVGSMISGVMFDSAPGYLHMITGARAFTEQIKNPVVKLLVKIAVFIHLSILSFFTGYKRQLNFCKTDRLIDCVKVDEMIATRRNQGVKVFYYKWEDSPHVQHLRAHREEYLAQVSNFLKEVSSS